MESVVSGLQRRYVLYKIGNIQNISYIYKKQHHISMWFDNLFPIKLTEGWKEALLYFLPNHLPINMTVELTWLSQNLKIFTAKQSI